jgi:hypothetical protein
MNERTRQANQAKLIVIPIESEALVISDFSAQPKGCTADSRFGYGCITSFTSLNANDEPFNDAEEVSEQLKERQAKWVPWQSNILHKPFPRMI